jgi:hypothetical protein
MFVKRNEHGKIIAASEIAQNGFVAIDANNDDLVYFLQKNLPDAHQNLKRSDAELARVLEDVIDLLTQKGVIQFTELPEGAQRKLLNRKSIRQVAIGLNLLNSDDGNDSIKL